MVKSSNAFKSQIDLQLRKLPGSDPIPAELIRARHEILQSEKLINSIWSKKVLPDRWKESIIVPVYKKGNKTDSSNYHKISFTFLRY
jgi:hypothetical protein